MVNREVIWNPEIVRSYLRVDLGIKAPTGETQTLEVGSDEQWETDCERQSNYEEPHITPVLPMELTMNI